MDLATEGSSHFINSYQYYGYVRFNIYLCMASMPGDALVNGQQISITYIEAVFLQTKLHYQKNEQHNLSININV